VQGRAQNNERSNNESDEYQGIERHVRRIVPRERKAAHHAAPVTGRTSEWPNERHHDRKKPFIGVSAVRWRKCGFGQTDRALTDSHNID